MAGQYSLVITDGIYEFAQYDYGRSIPFQLYDPTDAKFNATGYTAYIKVFYDGGSEAVTEISPSWTTQSTGAGNFAFTSSNKLTAIGTYYIEAQLEKAGQILTFRGIEQLSVYESPSGSRMP